MARVSPTRSASSEDSAKPHILDQIYLGRIAVGLFSIYFITITHHHSQLFPKTGETIRAFGSAPLPSTECHNQDDGISLPLGHYKMFRGVGVAYRKVLDWESKLDGRTESMKTTPKTEEESVGL